MSSPVITWVALQLRAPEPSLDLGGGLTWPLAWEGLQASWRGSQELGVGVETALVAHPPKTLGLRGHLFCGQRLPTQGDPLELSSPPALPPPRECRWCHLAGILG